MTTFTHFDDLPKKAVSTAASSDAHSAKSTAETNVGKASIAAHIVCQFVAD